MPSLEQRFDAAMMSVYQRAKEEADYDARKFFQMLHKDRGVVTAKTLINAPRPSEGYTALFERRRLDLTVEALVVENPEWHPLFSPEELQRARKRLTDYQYRFRGQP